MSIIDKKYSVGSIKYPEIYAHYEGMVTRFWSPKDITADMLAIDSRNFAMVAEGLQRIIKYVIAYFANVDGMIAEKTKSVFIEHWDLQDCISIAMAYRYIATIEDIHNQVYTKLVETYFPDRADREIIFNAVRHFGSIREKAKFTAKYLEGIKTKDVVDECEETIDSLHSLLAEHEGKHRFRKMREHIDDIKDIIRMPVAKSLIGMGFSEGVLFSSSFAFIRWLKTYQGNMFPSLALSNDLISPDEWDHVLQHSKVFAIKNNGYITEKKAWKIAYEARILEFRFVDEVLQVESFGMKVEQMYQHVSHVTNQVLNTFGFASLDRIDIDSPFGFYHNMAIESHVDFFKATSSSYSLPGSIDDEEDVDLSSDPY